MASSFFSSLRALARVMGVPAKRGAVAAALMARRAAGPEMPPPFWRCSCRAAMVSAVARAVSRSMRSWMPSRLREAYPSVAQWLSAVRMCPYWMARATRPLGRRAMCQARLRRKRVRPIGPCRSAGMAWPGRPCLAASRFAQSAKSSIRSRSAAGLLPDTEDHHGSGAGGADVGVLKSPAAGWLRGFSWGWCRWLWVRCRSGVGDFGDGGACGLLVDDGLAVDVGGDEGLEGELVDGAGVAAGGGVNECGGVVAEQGV